jgi:SAM-dependent methyltransferase
VSEYDQLFSGWTDRAAQSAAVVVPVILERFAPRSVVDIGCGTGAWLEVFAACGVTDYIGVDGAYVLDRDDLRIPPDHFVAADLEKPLVLDRRFDVALSLEVAEHLAPEAAELFVAGLAAAARIVVFSAAIPGQPGFHHVNLQWPAYWARLFADQGMRPADLIRPLIWEDERVEWWYRQNMFVFADEAMFACMAVAEADLRAVVHPEMHAEIVGSLRDVSQVGLCELGRAFVPAVKRAAVRRLRSRGLVE